MPFAACPRAHARALFARRALSPRLPHPITIAIPSHLPHLLSSSINGWAVGPATGGRQLEGRQSSSIPQILRKGVGWRGRERKGYSMAAVACGTTSMQHMLPSCSLSGLAPATFSSLLLLPHTFALPFSFALALPLPPPHLWLPPCLAYEMWLAGGTHCCLLLSLHLYHHVSWEFFLVWHCGVTV